MINSIIRGMDMKSLIKKFKLPSNFRIGKLTVDNITGELVFFLKHNTNTYTTIIAKSMDGLNWNYSPIMNVQVGEYIVEIKAINGKVYLYIYNGTRDVVPGVLYIYNEVTQNLDILLDFLIFDNLETRSENLKYYKGYYYLPNIIYDSVTLKYSIRLSRSIDSINWLHQILTTNVSPSYISYANCIFKDNYYFMDYDDINKSRYAKLNFLSDGSVDLTSKTYSPKYVNNTSYYQYNINDMYILDHYDNVAQPLIYLRNNLEVESSTIVINWNDLYPDTNYIFSNYDLLSFIKSTNNKYLIIKVNGRNITGTLKRNLVYYFSGNMQTPVRVTEFDNVVGDNEQIETIIYKEDTKEFIYFLYGTIDIKRYSLDLDTRQI